jgi:uncharacterized protein (AIM24 family)
MKTIGKIVTAGAILMVLAAAGCGAVLFAEASSPSHAINKAEKRDTAEAHAFAAKFGRVRSGDSLTGQGGMTKAQVRALLGTPKPGDVTETRSDGNVMTTWSYSFLMAKGSVIYSVSFTNGHVDSKSRM